MQCHAMPSSRSSVYRSLHDVDMFARPQTVSLSRSPRGCVSCGNAEAPRWSHIYRDVFEMQTGIP